MSFTLLKGKSAVNKARRNVVPNNANILTDVYGGDIDSAKQYMANMAKEIDPGVTSGTLNWEISQ